MKKIIAISIITVCLAAPAVFGQGWLEMITPRSQVWDGFSTSGVSQVDANVEVALLWAANNTANPMPLGLVNTPTNGNSAFLGYTLPEAWQDIYPNGTIQSGWTLALDNGDNGDGTPGAQVVMRTTSRGSISFDTGLGMDITGTPAGGSIALLLLSWNDAYSTPLAAEDADSAIGWSYLNSFALATAATSISMTNPTMTDFGTFGIPEPSTLVLAGLGGLSFLFARRKQ